MIIQRDKYTIQISDDVLAILDSYKNSDMRKEAGGIILGTVSRKNEITISKLSLPNMTELHDITLSEIKQSHRLL